MVRGWAKENVRLSSMDSKSMQEMQSTGGIVRRVAGEAAAASCVMLRSF